jgi:hypothetical protein
MKTEVTLTFQEGNCQCIAQDAALRYHNLEGNDIQHNTHQRLLSIHFLISLEDLITTSKDSDEICYMTGLHPKTSTT